MTQPARHVITGALGGPDAVAAEITRHTVGCMCPTCDAARAAFVAGRAAAGHAIREAGGAFPDIRRQCANLAEHGTVNDREPA